MKFIAILFDNSFSRVEYDTVFSGNSHQIVHVGIMDFFSLTENAYIVSDMQGTGALSQDGVHLSAASTVRCTVYGLKSGEHCVFLEMMG